MFFKTAANVVFRSKDCKPSILTVSHNLYIYVSCSAKNCLSKNSLFMINIFKAFHWLKNNESHLAVCACIRQFEMVESLSFLRRPGEDPRFSEGGEGGEREVRTNVCLHYLVVLVISIINFSHEKVWLRFTWLERSTRNTP